MSPLMTSSRQRAGDGVGQSRATMLQARPTPSRLSRPTCLRA